MNFGQLHGWQSFCNGMDKLTRTTYAKDAEFKRVVDLLKSSTLDTKALKRAADLAAYLRDYPP